MTHATSNELIHGSKPKLGADGVVSETTSSVRRVATTWLEGEKIDVHIGLPEYDDRLCLWRVALLSENGTATPIGEILVKDGVVTSTTDLALTKIRRDDQKTNSTITFRNRNEPITFPQLKSRLVLGDAVDALRDNPPNSVQLVFTSPPYYNAKPQYHESATYEEYLASLGRVFQMCHDVLSEGRFLVVNTSPVLIRRAHRNASSRRLPITYDLHAVLDRIGFEFVDDIVWQKPEGAGWGVRRGRRFSADRQPLQYKPVPVTENVTVYRKRTNKLIDWNIRNHPDPNAVNASLIEDGYERTNIWQISPARHKGHPAVFPEQLADRVIRYYSFQGDMVLDPFAGVGTTGRVAARLKRRFFMVERKIDYFEIMRQDAEIASDAPDVRTGKSELVDE